ncbi:MAG: hypothetical protein HY749_15865 [Gammaproteobacteria bacterium]|nr:hypothetical protein [Gammaproteobacteria bacterium]
MELKNMRAGIAAVTKKLEPARRQEAELAEAKKRRSDAADDMAVARRELDAAEQAENEGGALSLRGEDIDLEALHAARLSAQQRLERLEQHLRFADHAVDLIQTEVDTEAAAIQEIMRERALVTMSELSALLEPALAAQGEAWAALGRANAEVKAVLRAADKLHLQGGLLGRMLVGVPGLEYVEQAHERATIEAIEAAIRSAGAEVGEGQDIMYLVAQHAFVSGMPEEFRPRPAATPAPAPTNVERTRPRVVIDGVEQGPVDGTVRARHEPTFRVQPPAVPDFYG